MLAKLGVAPIAWTNDDLPELGGETSLETCLTEARAAGYTGIETGGKFPRDAQQLLRILNDHRLQLASGWYSGTVLDNELTAEKDRADSQLQLFRETGAACIVYGETAGTIQNLRDAPLASRRKLHDDEFPAYGRRLTEFAEHCAEQSVPLALHYHMGTVIENEADLDLLMRHTGEAVHLLYDSGHMAFAGGDPLAVIERHAKRILHVHMKDVRQTVLDRLDRKQQSFLDAVLAGVFTVPGDGRLDFNAIVGRLHDVGYEGWFIVEAEQDPKLAPPAEFARMGYEALRQALTEAGYEIGV